MDAKTKIEELSGNVKEYVNIQVKLINLKVVEKASSIVANVTFVVILSLLALLFIIFGSIALGYYLASVTGSISLGFLLLTSIYLVAYVVLFSFREKLVINPLRNILIKQMLENE
jgi:hypothetical protein